MILWSQDSGIDILVGDRTYKLEAGSLRPLLFPGNRVRLTGGDAVVWPGFDRQWILFALERTLYLIHRSRLVRVARGEVPSDELGREGTPDPGVRLQRQRPDRRRRRRPALFPPARTRPPFSPHSPVRCLRPRRPTRCAGFRRMTGSWRRAYSWKS